MKYSYSDIHEKVNLYVERFYVMAFNIYAFYWLYKLIFIEGHSWEDWLLWFFACMGVNIFFKDNRKRLAIGEETKPLKK